MEGPVVVQAGKHAEKSMDYVDAQGNAVASPGGGNPIAPEGPATPDHS